METQDTKQNFGTVTIGELVAADYRKAEVFKKFGIDFCCGGKTTLDQICSRKGIDAAEVEHALRQLDDQPGEPDSDFNQWELDALVDYIVHTHHTYVNESLPLLDEFGGKVAKVHGHANPEVVEIYRHCLAVANEMRMHMYKEEVILFPYIKQLAVANRSDETISAPPFGTVRNPIQMMEAEHDSAGGAMAAIKELSNDYSPPEHACNTYRVFYAKLQEFENDLHRHVHLENNILFPKAVLLEERLTG